VGEPVRIFKRTVFERTTSSRSISSGFKCIFEFEFFKFKLLFFYFKSLSYTWYFLKISKKSVLLFWVFEIVSTKPGIFEKVKFKYFFELYSSLLKFEFQLIFTKLGCNKICFLKNGKMLFCRFGTNPDLRDLCKRLGSQGK
jgi:hypothetical protein